MKRSGWPTTSRHARGYGTEWSKTRERIMLRDYGICQPCMKQGHIHVGTEVDHIVSKAKAQRLGWTKERVECDDNLQAICATAHKIKTAQEQGRTLRPKQTIGIDGFRYE